MRLLHTKDLHLEELHGKPYAILSHRWIEQPGQEVSFQDLQRRKTPDADLHSDVKVEDTFHPDVCGKEGFSKLIGACKLALQDGLEYIWIDTCCIDKTSSAELSEAINSMYAWYRDSAVCYVYLDVQYNSDQNELISALHGADWFKRGWTLQELIAPSSVYFFARDWSRIGSKATWVSVLHEITRIREEVLLGSQPPCESSIAERMSWTVKRKTTKIEDRAYSLMGIFEIHMPIIYGEGEKAFRRLQLEIMKSSNDQTIFAWRDSVYHPHHLRTRGALASSPDVFLWDDSPLINDHSFSHLMPRSAGWRSLFQNRSIPEDGYTIQNDGIHITLPMKQVRDSWLAVLKCKTEDQGLPYGIYLHCETSDSNRFLRRAAMKLRKLELSDLEGLTLKKIRLVIDHHPPPTIPRRESFTLRSAERDLSLCGYYICPKPGDHEGQLGSGRRLLFPDSQIKLENTQCGCVYFRYRYEIAILLIGVEDHRPWIHLRAPTNFEDLPWFIDAWPSDPIFNTSQFTSEPLPKDTDPISPLSLSPTALPAAGFSSHSTSQKYSQTSLPLQREPTGSGSYRSPQRSKTSRPVKLRESTSGCAVCAVIRHMGINIPEIKATRDDLLTKMISGHEVEVNVRKGRAGTSEMEPGLVEYVVTIAIKP